MARTFGARAALGAATLALAGAFAVAPALLPPGQGDAAWAKDKDRGEKERGDRDRGEKDRGGKDRGERERGKERGGKERAETSRAGQKAELRQSGGKGASAAGRGQAKPEKVGTAKAARAAPVEGAPDALATLPPSRKGKWNAMNASDRALAAHVANGNFNGTVGALAEYRLTARAASGADLTDVEQAALDGLLAARGLDGGAGDVTDAEVTAALNAALEDGTGYSLSYAAGEVTCEGLCDEVDLEAVALDAEAFVSVETAERAALAADTLEALHAASRARILGDSNKSYSPAEIDLLFGELDARLLGDAAPAPEADEGLADELADDLLDDLLDGLDAEGAADDTAGAPTGAAPVEVVAGGDGAATGDSAGDDTF